jgi:hypothetical protein
LTLESSNQTAKFLKPPSSSRVSVFIDNVEVPRSGLVSTPEISFTKPEPYTIRKNQNDLIYIKIGNELPKFITVESGSNIRAVDIVRDLKNKLPELDVDVLNARVRIKNKVPFIGTAFSFPDPRWTDKTAVLTTTARTLAFYNEVGLIPGRSVVGKTILPGWDVVKDPNVLFSDEKLIVFKEPIRNQDSYIQVHYVTSAANCRRCGGIRIEFDYSILNTTYETVTDTDLLSQELDKFLFTRIGSHFKWNWLGSGLVNRVGSKSNAGGVATNAVLTSDIAQAFNTYRDIKSQQDSRFPFQQVSDAEFPYSLNNINVDIPDEDPTIAIISVEISSRSLVPVPLKRIIGNPNPFTLAQDPQAYLRLTQNTDFMVRA